MIRLAVLLYQLCAEHVDESLLVFLVYKKLILSHGKLHALCECYTIASACPLVRLWCVMSFVVLL